MTSKPPPLPHDVLTRVLRLASADGRLLLFIPGAFALIAAASHDVSGALVGVVAAGAGAMELHGVSLVKNGEVRGVDWMVRSQLLLLGTILLYAAIRILQFDPETVRPLITPEIRTQFNEAGLGEEAIMPFIERIYHAFYLIVGLVTFFYQGSMALYYRRRRELVRAALETP